MVIDLSYAIESLEIDNRIAGLVNGELRLVGLSSPIKLVLEGDCWRDLAGSKLTAHNRANLEPWHGEALPGEIRGEVGDCTASRKQLHVTPNEDGDSETSESWRPCLSIEFFSESTQRYLIQGTHFQLSLEDNQWQMGSDEEAAQQMANQQAMRSYVQHLMHPPSGPEEPDPEADDEFSWELRLQHSDRLNDAYGEVMSKYAEDRDSETKEAFVMGWDTLLNSLAEESESHPSNPLGDFTDNENDWSEMDFDPSDETSYEEEIEVVQHPLQKAAMELVSDHTAAVRRLKGKVPSEQIDAFYVPFIKVPAKLAAALNGDTMEQIPGYSLAVLKRCTNWIQETLSALPAIAAPLGRARANVIKQKLFELREGILEARSEIKGNDS